MTPNSLQTPIDALLFAVDFAQLELQSADLRRVSNRLRQFFVLVPGFVAGRPWSLDELTTVQEAILELLGSVLVKGFAVADVKLQITVVRDGSRAAAGVNGSLRDRTLYRVIRLVEDLGTEKLLRCPEQACGRLFFKVTRKEFCSTRCQSRAYMRARRRQERDTLTDTLMAGRGKKQRTPTDKRSAKH